MYVHASSDKNSQLSSRWTFFLWDLFLHFENTYYCHINYWCTKVLQKSRKHFGPFRELSVSLANVPFKF